MRTDMHKWKVRNKATGQIGQAHYSVYGGTYRPMFAVWKNARGDQPNGGYYGIRQLVFIVPAPSRPAQ